MRRRYEPNRLRVLSLRQPRAYLIVAGLRDADVLSQATAFRGRLLIHASRDRDPAGFAMAHREGIELPELYFGGIIGAADLVEVEPNEKGWRWMFANPKPLPVPLECQGRPYLFSRSVPAEVLRVVLA